MKIVLCGPPFVGKSYYAHKLSEALKRNLPFMKWEFLDTDRLIERRYFLAEGNRLTCREIAKQRGNVVFRHLEKKAIESLTSEGSNLIIAIGGGAMEREENAVCLKQLAHLVYLKADFSLLLARLKQEEELPAYLDPFDPERSFLRLVEKRSLAYTRYADLIVPLKHEKEQEVVQFLQNYILYLLQTPV